VPGFLHVRRSASEATAEAIMGNPYEINVAIVGAGIAGLTAARRLAEAGCTVALFEKSDGLGGRMATRRVDLGGGIATFDHGVACIQPPADNAFAALVGGWRRAGVAAPWANAGLGGMVGIPEMTAIPRDMAQGLSIIRGQTITGLRRTGGTWTLAGGPATGPQQSWQGFGAVLLAIPSPQITPILDSANLRLEGLEEARFQPVWTLMVAVGRPLTPPGGALTDPDRNLIASVVENSSKPGRRNGDKSAHCYVVHASGAWSAANLEREKHDVQGLMLAALGRATGAPVAPLYAAAHRWRYGLVATALGRPCLWDADVRVGACGDWCLGDRVEHAFLSGRSLAHAVIDTLGRGSVVA
jgi:renalase